jgi:hypothetical protein
MADLLSAMREFRYLDEKRLLGALAPAEQQRWEELRAMVAPHAEAPTVVAPAPEPSPTPIPTAFESEPPTVVSQPTTEFPSQPITEVEPPFVDAELTEDAGPGSEDSQATAVSAFDRSPIPQPPAGVQPMLLEIERPSSDFEATAVAQTEYSLPTDVEPTAVGPLPLTTPTPSAGQDVEAMLEGIQAVAEPHGGDIEARAATEPGASPQVVAMPPPSSAVDHTAVIPPSATPWRAFSTPAISSREEDAAEAEFFKNFGSHPAVSEVEQAPQAPLPELPQGDTDPEATALPKPKAVLQSDAPVLAPERSPLQPPDAVVAQYSPGEQRVVVHTLEGLQTRGFLAETDLGRHAILLRKQDGSEQWFNIEELKAVFFLLAPEQQPSPAQGQRVTVRLRDGRTLLGTAVDPGQSAVGFYLFPEEGNARIDRIFLYLQAIKDITPA